MAILITVEEVKELLDINSENVTVRHSFIDTANVYREANITSTTLSTAVLKKIELYLAAHFAALTEEKGGIIREEMGDSSDMYNNSYGPGLNSTRFGQTAIILDTSGVLASLASPRAKAQFRVV